MEKSIRSKLNDGYYKNNLPYKTRKGDSAIHDAWQAEEGRRIVEFEKDLAEHFGVDKHQKRKKLWDIAWEHGHSSGLHEVLNFYEDFVELLR